MRKWFYNIFSKKVYKATPLIPNKTVNNTGGVALLNKRRGNAHKRLRYLQKIKTNKNNSVK